MTHLDTDVLAEFRAGLITGRRGARIAAHLAGCERCTALDDQLAGVSALLASVPAPALPDRVAQRLDTVLAAEVARNNNHPERAGRDAAGESAAPGRPPQNRGFRLLALRVLAPAAAVVLLGAGVFGLTRLGLGSSSSSSASSAAAGTAQATVGAKSASGARNPSEARPLEGAAPRSQEIAPARIMVTIGHQNFTRADLEQQVKAALLARASARTHRALTPQERACVQHLAGRHRVLLVESARFEGRPATLIVARTGRDDTAWIADPGCPATSRDVLDTTSLPSGISGP